jgi:hypothetical protein
MADSPTLDITYVEEGQNNAEVTINAAVNRLESMAQLAVVDRDVSAAPGSPTNGQIWLINGAGSGAWAGHTDEFAFYYDGWTFLAPFEGILMRVLDENEHFMYSGSAWERIPVGDQGPVSDLNQTISGTYTQSEVQAISDKVDELLADLRTGGILTT